MKNPAGTSTAGPARVAFVLVPRFNMMMLTATIEPMRVANYLAPRRCSSGSTGRPKAARSSPATA